MLRSYEVSLSRWVWIGDFKIFIRLLANKKILPLEMIVNFYCDRKILLNNLFCVNRE